MKICVIGAGQVGATVAQRIIEKGLGDAVLLDIAEGLAEGKSLDMIQSAYIEGFTSKIIGINDFKKITGSQIVIVTAGFTRKQGMSRTDLLLKNVEIIKSISVQIREYAPNSLLLMVTNPLDIMAYVALKITGFNPAKVIGMAGLLDSARYCAFIAQEAGVAIKDVQALVLGGHGDSMVPLPEYTVINGIPVSNFLSKESLDKIIEHTRNGGAEIISLLKTGSAYYSPSSCVVDMVKAIVYDEKRVITASVYLKGEYGYHDIYLGVPIILGKNGMEKIVSIPLSLKAKTDLDKSAKIVKDVIKEIEGKI
ncbi:MAG: malate dehydrogenase [Candidatus Firestonebacteria bacterium]|nr:malate dehydrogenase [Candidatus Firestonebacteria bacterium]